MAKKAKVFLGLLAVLLVGGAGVFIGSRYSPGQQTSAVFDSYILYAKQDLYRDANSPLASLGLPFSLTSDLALFDLRTSKTANITIGGLKERSSFSPDGKIYYSVGRKDAENIWVIDLLLRTYKPFLKPSDFINGTIDDFSLYTSNPACSHDGKALLFESNPSGVRTIFRVGADKQGLKQLTRGTTHCGSPDWSPDDKHIAYDCLIKTGEKTGAFTLWVMDRDGAKNWAVSNDQKNNYHRPVWRPSGGRWLAFYSDRSGKYGIYALLLDKDNQVKNMVEVVVDGYNNTNPKWSPDGQYIVYQSERPYQDNDGKIQEDFDLYMVKFDPKLPGQPIPITKGLNDESDPLWLPRFKGQNWIGSLLDHLNASGLIFDSTALKTGI